MSPMNLKEDSQEPSPSSEGHIGVEFSVPSEREVWLSAGACEGSGRAPPRVPFHLRKTSPSSPQRAVACAWLSCPTASKGLCLTSEGWRSDPPVPGDQPSPEATGSPAVLTTYHGSEYGHAFVLLLRHGLAQDEPSKAGRRAEPSDWHPHPAHSPSAALASFVFPDTERLRPRYMHPLYPIFLFLCLF
jgi:hypothetical protein